MASPIDWGAHPSAQTALDQQSHYFRRSSFSDFFNGIRKKRVFADGAANVSNRPFAPHMQDLPSSYVACHQAVSNARGVISSAFSPAFVRGRRVAPIETTWHE
jgi:hypothetical protein